MKYLLLKETQKDLLHSFEHKYVYRVNPRMTRTGSILTQSDISCFSVKFIVIKRVIILPNYISYFSNHCIIIECLLIFYSSTFMGIFIEQSATNMKIHQTFKIQATTFNSQNEPLFTRHCISSLRLRS